MTTKSASTKHHYVPRFLLKNFGSGKKQHIYGFDKQTDREFRTTATNIAAEIGFYDYPDAEAGRKVETALSSIEAPASRSIAKIIKAKSIGGLIPADRDAIAGFSALQMLRVKSQREKLQHLDVAIHDLLGDSGSKPVDPEIYAPASAEQVRLESIHMLKYVPEFAPQFESKRWILLQSPPAHPYFISDSPVALTNTLNRNPHWGTIGVAVPGIEIYLPLSSRFCLAMWCPSIEAHLRDSIDSARQAWSFDFPKPIGEHAESLLKGFETGDAVPCTIDNVMHSNSLQVMNSSRFVYCQNPGFQLARRMIRDDPAFRVSRTLQVD